MNLVIKLSRDTVINRFIFVYPIDSYKNRKNTPSCLVNELV
jgi:hypothetical protein